jgi:predicted  nucleic acid-binding Zn-ribbon protein
MKTSIYSQHYEHTEWLNVLSFYKDDIKIMQKRIEEIVQKNTANDIMAQVEHFQNQLIIQQNHIDDMRKHIEKDEQHLISSVKTNEIAVDHRKLEDHTSEREDITAFEKNFEDLRKNLNRFLAKYM